MKRFTELYMELDASNRTTAKLAALKRYFAEAPAADAAWAVYFLTGQRLKRVVITGGFRVGVSKTLVNRARAEVAGVEPAMMAHRLMGDWQPTPANYRALFAPESAQDDPARPYPFCLAYPLDDKAPATLGPVADWQIEWKWDGIRAQLIKRGGEVLLWSRGEELVGAQFPEVIEAAHAWPEEVVLDGELLSWRGDGPAAFSELQRRLGRKKVGPKLRKEVPVVFMAYDLMERKGVDYRGESTRQRREALATYAAQIEDGTLQLSRPLEVDSWAAVEVESRPLHRRCRAGLRPAGPWPPGRTLYRLHLFHLARRDAGALRQSLLRPLRQGDPRGRPLDPPAHAREPRPRAGG